MVASFIHRLSDRQIKASKQRGRLSDGGGLYLQISKWGTKSWEFRFTLHGRTRTMGLGLYDFVPLKQARVEAEELRKTVRRGEDPIEARNAARRKAQTEAAAVILFADAVEKCIARKEGEFRSERHRKNWRRSMDAYAVPIIGSMNVAHITLQDILRVLNQPFEEALYGRKEPKPPHAFAAASKLSCRGQPSRAIAAATIRRAGLATSRNFCRRHPRWRKLRSSRPCRKPILHNGLRPYASAKAWPHGRLSS